MQASPTNLTWNRKSFNYKNLVGVEGSRVSADAVGATTEKSSIADSIAFRLLLIRLYLLILL